MLFLLLSLIPKKGYINRVSSTLVCVCIYLALWGLGPNRSALLVWEQQYAEWSSLLSLTTPISKICVALAWVSCVFASHASDLDGAHVILPGADEQDLARNSEAGSDGWGVLSQTEAGQHGGDANQLTPAGFDRHKAEQSWGTQSQQTCFQTHSARCQSLWSRNGKLVWCLCLMGYKPRSLPHLPEWKFSLLCTYWCIVELNNRMNILLCTVNPVYGWEINHYLILGHRLRVLF